MFYLNALYLASFLFARLKFTCVNMRSGKRVSGNESLKKYTRRKILKTEYFYVVEIELCGFM